MKRQIIIFALGLMCWFLSAFAAQAQDKNMLQQHIQTGLTAIQNKDLNGWRTLFLDRKGAYEFFSKTNPELLTLDDAKLIEYKLESEFLKMEAALVDLFIQQFKDYKQGSYVNIDWQNLQMKNLIVENESFTVGNDQYKRYYGWILLEQPQTKKSYLGSFNNVLSINGKIFGLDLVKEQEINANEFEKIVAKIKSEGNVPAVSQSPSIASTATDMKEDAAIYTGNIDGKAVQIHWSTLSTIDGVQLIHDVRMTTNKNDEETIFDISILDDNHFILTAEDMNGYFHVQKTNNQLKGTWFSKDQSNSNKFILQLKK